MHRRRKYLLILDIFDKFLTFRTCGISEFTFVDKVLRDHLLLGLRN